MLLCGHLKALEHRVASWMRIGIVLILVTCLLVSQAAAASVKELKDQDSSPEILDQIRLHRQIRSWRQPIVEYDDVIKALKRNSENQEQLERAYGWMERYPKRADRGGWGGGYGK